MVNFVPGVVVPMPTLPWIIAPPDGGAVPTYELPIETPPTPLLLENLKSSDPPALM